jgi:DNA-binding transcriptional ArsR family regulator
MMTTALGITGLYQDQAALCRTLSHPVRLAILSVLRDGEQCVCHLEAALGLRQAYISQHLKVLREAGLVDDRRDGWNIFYRLCEPRIRKVTDSLSAFSGEPGRRLVLRASSRCPCPKCSS